MPRAGTSIVLVSAVGAAFLVAVVGIDAGATRHELLSLLRGEATALQRTLAAALRANRAAGAALEAQLGERLLQEARALAEIDRRGGLNRAALEQRGARYPLARVGVFAPDGTREAPGLSPGLGPGARGARAGGGRGSGRGPTGPGGAGPGIVREILEGGPSERVTGVHANRWGGGERIAAAVRRAGGGVIMVAVDASAVAELRRPSSVQALLEPIAGHDPQVAYAVFEHAGGRLSVGAAPAAGSASSAVEGERETSAGDGRPVLELVSTVSLDGEDPARLRLGMSLEDVRRVERRMAARLAFSVLAAGLLVSLAFGVAGLRRRYTVLSEKHGRAEEALRRRDRLAAMGELASTVAHEVRNPLNAVAMTAQRLRRALLDGRADESLDREELEDLLGVMTSETRRIDRIVQQFLDYARPPRLAPEPTDLRRLAEGLVERTRPLAETRGVSLEAAEAESVTADVDPGQLTQALENLVRNAIEATPPGGRVTISVRAEEGRPTIEVRDTGHGIDPEQQGRIFDLYFTTRENGTGVGLAVSQQILSAHGGTIEVDSRRGAGTAMTLRLPRPGPGAPRV
jgi:signal transduction histidine kinase